MDYLPIFIAVTAAAVVLQALILAAMYLALRKVSARVESLAGEVSSKVLPTAAMAQAMMTELRPKIEAAVSNISETTSLARGQLERMDATLNDIIDRTRLQIIRADELVGRTLDRVEETTEMVHKTVISPVRQLSGIMHGVTAGLGAFLGNRRRPRQNVTVPQDEMFI